MNYVFWINRKKHNAVLVTMQNFQRHLQTFQYKRLRGDDGRKANFDDNRRISLIAP